MGASLRGVADIRAQQLASQGIRQRRQALSDRTTQAITTPQGQVPGIKSEQVFNPSLGVPGAQSTGELFQDILTGRRRMF